MPLPHPAALTFLAALAASPVVAAETLSFNEHIRPILSQNCFACHGADSAHRKAGLRLDEPVSAYAERKGVRAIVPGNLQASEAWRRIVSTDEKLVMPPPKSHKTLSAAERESSLIPPSAESPE